MTEPYCGIGSIPKGRHRGNMQECADRGEIRYYGLKKVDKRIIDAMKNKKYKNTGIEKLAAKKGELVGKVNKIIKMAKKEKDSTKKESLKREGKKYLKDIEEIDKKIKELKNKEYKKQEERERKENKKNEREAKKSSKKSSIKKPKRSQYGGGNDVRITRRRLN